MTLVARVATAATAAGMWLDAEVMRLWSGAPRRAAADAPPLPTAVRSAREILVVALAEMGDAVLLSPFLRELRRLAPAARLTLVVRPAVSDLFAPCPHVDEVLAYETAAPRTLRPLALPPRARRFAAAHLDARRPDLAINPRWDTDHHLATAVMLFSGASRRVAYSERVGARKRVLNRGFDRLVTDPIPAVTSQHEVERALDVVRFLGGRVESTALELWLTPEDAAAAAAALGPPEPGPLVAIGVGAADPKRRWPVDRYAEVARALADARGARIVVVGGAGDRAAQAELVALLGAHRAVGLAGDLRLRQTAAVLARCDLFIGNDSGPAHLAAAAGAAVLTVSCHPRGCDPEHSNAPERFRPWTDRAAVLRPDSVTPPCGEGCAAVVPHCILAIDTATVAAAATALL